MEYFAFSPNGVITMISESAAVRNIEEIEKGTLRPGYIFFCAELAPLEEEK